MYVTNFEVKISNFFPGDMLRYDHCYPYSGEDVDKIFHFEPGDPARIIRLTTRHATKKDNNLTPERWASFGCGFRITGTRRL
jgi:hypothetical protein